MFSFRRGGSFCFSLPSAALPSAAFTAPPSPFSFAAPLSCSSLSGSSAAFSFSASPSHPLSLAEPQCSVRTVQLVGICSGKVTVLGNQESLAIRSECSLATGQCSVSLVCGPDDFRRTKAAFYSFKSMLLKDKGCCNKDGILSAVSGGFLHFFDMLQAMFARSSAVPEFFIAFALCETIHTLPLT